MTLLGMVIMIRLFGKTQLYETVLFELSCRLLVLKVPDDPGPCAALYSISWLTSSVDHMEASHNITTLFYSNDTVRCRKLSARGTRLALGHSTKVKFSYKRMKVV